MKCDIVLMNLHINLVWCTKKERWEDEQRLARDEKKMEQREKDAYLEARSRELSESDSKSPGRSESDSKPSGMSESGFQSLWRQNDFGFNSMNQFGIRYKYFFNRLGLQTWNRLLLLSYYYSSSSSSFFNCCPNAIPDSTGNLRTNAAAKRRNR